MKILKVGSKLITENGDFFIAEIGINHNGDVTKALELIEKASISGAHAVKFQKRTINKVYTPDELSTPRESVFGNTNGDLKRGLEFGFEEYRKIADRCEKLGIEWFASAWDLESVDFLESLGVVAHKIASPLLTNVKLLERLKQTRKPLIVSTGMSTINQIDSALSLLKDSELVLLHCVSTYPAKEEELNLSVIKGLRDRYNCLVGYSGHEKGIMPSVIASVMYGACVIERHLTLDRSDWGSDQSASLEPQGFSRMVKYIGESKRALGDGQKRLLESEVLVKAKLRKVEDF